VSSLHARAAVRSSAFPAVDRSANGIFPVIASVGAKLTQNYLLLLSPSLSVTIVNRSQKFPPPLVPQPGLLKLLLVGLHSKWRDVVPLGYILDGATRPSTGKQLVRVKCLIQLREAMVSNLATLSTNFVRTMQRGASFNLHAVKAEMSERMAEAEAAAKGPSN